MDRRTFLRLALVAAGSSVAANVAIPGFEAAFADTGETRYGPIGSVPDVNDLLLPKGFRSRLVAIGGEVVEGTSYAWHPYPDGGACFAAEDGGWVYVSNSEVSVLGRGGAGAVRFDAKGRIVDAYPILTGTTMNCSGGKTSWGTWLSCEEIEEGRVWECDPFGRDPAVVRPALGILPHEVAIADRARKVLYLTEDRPDGLFYRFRPERWRDLTTGTLEAASVSREGHVTWLPVPDPEAKSGTVRSSVTGATPFNGGEGAVVYKNAVFFTTKGDNFVRRLDLRTSRLSDIWEGSEPLQGADNLTVHRPTGDLFVCEDGGNMELVVIGSDGNVAPFARFVGQDESEVTGVAFDPSGTRLYFSSQRAPTPKRVSDVVPGTTDNQILGRTFEVTGPFPSA